MKSCAQYIAGAKRAKGDDRMSDRALHEHLGRFSQQEISRAKRGYMTDQLAIAIAEAAGEPPGEVIWVARIERERDVKVRQHLEAWARRVGKALASVPAKSVSALAALAVALGLLMPAHNAEAATGGEGGQ